MRPQILGESDLGESRGTHRDRSPTKLLGEDEWRRGLTFPTPAWNV